MDFTDVKYIGLVSSRFQKFKRVKNNLYNFRCPLCGDSCERIIDLSAFQLKGGGWFRDGYIKKTESKKEDKE